MDVSGITEENRLAFYNTNIIEESLESDINVQVALLLNDDNWVSTKLTEPLFTTIHFFADIKEGDTVIESRHSTINLPSVVQVITDENIKKDYNTTRDVISFVSIKQNNFLLFFYNKSDIDTFGDNPPLVVKQDKTAISDILSNPTDYISDYEEENQYGLDLFSFITDNTIDYNGMPSEMPNNIQFVFHKDYNGSKNLVLKNSTNNELNIGQELNNYPGIISFDTGIQTVKFNNNDNNIKYTYNIQCNDGINIITSGNIDLLFTNNGTLKLNKILNESKRLNLIKKDNSDLIIKTKNIKMNNDATIKCIRLNMQLGN